MRINDACQKNHVLAIDLFLLMLLVFSFSMKITATQYEVVPDSYVIETTTGVFYPGYEQLTSNELITEAQQEVLRKDHRSFVNRITLFGTIIFVLYSFTQWSRWKKRFKERFQSDA